MEILIIIPARGGSKGIPRKNLRLLGGKPLLTYSIRVALGLRYAADVFVSTDDIEIANCSTQNGAQVHIRPTELANDNATLDPVIYDAYEAIRIKNKKDYNFIITLQPTSPLLKISSLNDAIQLMIDDESIDTLISAMNDTHLTWKLVDGSFVQNYTARVNRQFLTPVFRETGGFLITRPSSITSNGRIGKSVSLFELKGEERIDIDDYEDWSLCEFYLNRKKVGLFALGSTSEDTFIKYLDSIILHELYIFIDQDNLTLKERISSSNFNFSSFYENDLVKLVKSKSLDLVIIFGKKNIEINGFKELSQNNKHYSVHINESKSDIFNLQAFGFVTN